ncbi:MAG: O-antigen ligase family protein [Pseudomonadota bacterium]
MTDFRHQITRTNGLAVSLTVLGAAIFGSVISVFVWAGGVLGVFRLIFEWRKVVIPAPVAITGAVFALYFLAELFSAVINDRGVYGLIHAAGNIIFLSFIPLYIVLEQPRQQIIDMLLKLAAPFAAAALTFAMVQLYILDYRPQGGASNPGVFAMTTALIYGVNLINLKRNATSMAIAGVIIAFVAVVLAGSRPIWPVLFLLPLVVFLFGTKINWPHLRRSALIAGSVFAVVIVVALSGYVKDRIDRGLSDIERASDGDLATSYGKRVSIWRVALSAIEEKPFFGHGPDTPIELMRERARTVGGYHIYYNHFHNAALNEMVRAGIPGVIAMFAMFVVPFIYCWRSRNDQDGGDVGFLLLVALQLTWLLSGTVGIMFNHDILDALFTSVTAISLYFCYSDTTSDSVV